MSAPQRELIEAILAYLARHPQAADSVDGVARWWLARLGQTVLRDQVEQALNTMVELGLLRHFELPDGSVIYGCDGGALH